MGDRACAAEKPGRHLFDEELERHRKVAAHNDIAFAAAFHLCASEGKCPPQWLVTAVDNLLIELLKREKSINRGRSAGRVARCRQDLWDFERFLTVEEIRRIRCKNKDELGLMKDDRTGFEKRFSYLQKVHRWLGYGTFECAAMYLRGTFAWGSPYAVRKSYQKVRKAFAARSGNWRYYMFPGDFLGRVGIPYPLTPMPGTKTANFCDLEP